MDIIGGKGCDKYNELLPVNGKLEDFEIELYLNCEEETVSITVEYSGFNDNWFGLVFNDKMDGDALVFTTGKDNDRDSALYPYTISSKSADGVKFDAGNDWTELSKVESGGVLTVSYEQSLASSPFSRETESVTMRAA